MPVTGEISGSVWVHRTWRERLAAERHARRGVGGRGPPRNRPGESLHNPHSARRRASAQREAWGVGGRGMAAAAAKSLRAVAGAEAEITCAYTRGFQISA